MTIGDASLGQIVGRHFKRHPIPCQDANPIAAQFAGQVSQHLALLIELHAKQTAREFLNYGSSHFNAVFFTPFPPTTIITPWRPWQHGRRPHTSPSPPLHPPPAP